MCVLLEFSWKIRYPVIVRWLLKSTASRTVLSLYISTMYTDYLHIYIDTLGAIAHLWEEVVTSTYTFCPTTVWFCNLIHSSLHWCFPCISHVLPVLDVMVLLPANSMLQSETYWTQRSVPASYTWYWIISSKKTKVFRSVITFSLSFNPVSSSQ